MAVKSGFFMSVNGDRKYDAAFFAEYFASFIGNGIFPNPSTILQVVEGSNMQTIVKPGKGWINGYYVHNDSDFILQHDIADGVLKRIDRIVLQWNYLTRQIAIVLKKGTFASNPVAPALQRDTDYHELALADVLINNGATQITQANITDLRLNKDYCGIVHGLIDQVDTTELYNQYLDFWNTWKVQKVGEFAQFQTDSQSKFDEQQNANQSIFDDMVAANQLEFEQWFESVKGMLEGDVAANLSLQISALNEKVTSLEKTAATKEEVKTLTETITAHKDETVTQLVQQATEINRLRKINNEQNKELAFLKLKQDAADRIEGGTTFADDIQGNSFGITFNEEASENAVIRNGGLTMNEGAMVENSVDDSVVMEGVYSTSGNGGRRLVLLENGTLVCTIKTGTAYYLYKSVDGGSSWVEIYQLATTSIQDVSIETDGIYIYLIGLRNNSTVASSVFDDSGSLIGDVKFLTASQTALDKCSLAINEEGTELHACWISKNSTYPNSYNIQYCKGLIGEGGSITWRSVEQITRTNSSGEVNNYPSITLNSNGYPVILHRNYNGSYYFIYARYYNGASWNSAQVCAGKSYSQTYPSSIFVPKSVNGLENGRIWVTWCGMDTTSPSYYTIKVSYSDDNGATWSSTKILASYTGYHQYDPSITANKNNEVFVTFHGYTYDSTSSYLIKQIKWSNDAWGTVDSINQLSGNHVYFPSTLYDINFTVDFTKPLYTYTIFSKSINFAGSWTAGGYTPTTSATAVYTLPSTDYVGLFVQKEGGVNITATVNDTPMDAVVDGNEYQFTKALDSETPVTLKLSLSRENTTNGDNDKVTRILGGIS